ncbi:hypothetical protein CK203_016251 [Vitis vinifera]|uniref:Uncharacterized protein n=1 Tax=Vitis vinifera TaxID=29760 RepID=A0A438JN01_VITVI|nr:hypothetical protein CK203_116109 [Vitis vinifera]RVX10333.1 hypothetical protein CK203_016251 [Vitis vinifera]
MDVSLESKSLPSVGNSRKSYLQVTSQRLVKGKLVYLLGRRSLALPSVGPGDFKAGESTALYKKVAKSSRNKRVISQRCAKFFLQLGVIGLQWLFIFASPPCIPDLLMEKDFKALVLHEFELSNALPRIPNNSPHPRIALSFYFLSLVFRVGLVIQSHNSWRSYSLALHILPSLFHIRPQFSSLRCPMLTAYSSRSPHKAAYFGRVLVRTPGWFDRYSSLIWFFESFFGTS